MTTQSPQPPEDPQLPQEPPVTLSHEGGIVMPAAPPPIVELPPASLPVIRKTSPRFADVDALAKFQVHGESVPVQPPVARTKDPAEPAMIATAFVVGGLIVSAVAWMLYQLTTMSAQMDNWLLQ